jgi:hypothetical protein
MISQIKKNGVLLLAIASIVVGLSTLTPSMFLMHVGLTILILTVISQARLTGWAKACLTTVTLVGVPVYFISALTALYSYSDEIEQALASRKVIDDNKAAYQDFVSEFAEHADQDLMFPIRSPIEHNSISSLHTEVSAFFGNAHNLFLPAELGEDPIRPTSKMFKTSDAITLIDMAGMLKTSIADQERLAKKLGKPVSEITPADYAEIDHLEVRRPSTYQCLLDADGNLLHLSAYTPDLLYLDLTNDPTFFKIGSICEKEWKLDRIVDTSEMSVVRDRARKKLGLPEITFLKEEKPEE